MVNKLWARTHVVQSRLNTCLYFLVPILGSMPNHTITQIQVSFEDEQLDCVFKMWANHSRLDRHQYHHLMSMRTILNKVLVWGPRIMRKEIPHWSSHGLLEASKIVEKVPAPAFESPAMIHRGEPAVRYKWTGWVWEMTGWSSSRLQEKELPSILEEFCRIYIPQFNNGKWEDVNM